MPENTAVKLAQQPLSAENQEALVAAVTTIWGWYQEDEEKQWDGRMFGLIVDAAITHIAFASEDKTPEERKRLATLVREANFWACTETQWSHEAFETTLSLAAAAAGVELPAHSYEKAAPEVDSEEVLDELLEAAVSRMRRRVAAGKLPHQDDMELLISAASETIGASYEYAIRMEAGLNKGKTTVPDDDLAGTQERLVEYQSWDPGARLVRRRKVGEWKEL
jgi:hypothetical protein